MAEAYYEPTPATDGATMNPVPGAVFEVYEIADTGFTTPLSLRVGSGNPTTTVTASDTLATLPGVYVTSDNFEHIWKSGSFEWRRDSITGAKLAIEAAKQSASDSESLAFTAASEAAASAQSALDAAAQGDLVDNHEGRLNSLEVAAGFAAGSTTDAAINNVLLNAASLSSGTQRTSRAHLIREMPKQTPYLTHEDKLSGWRTKLTNQATATAQVVVFGDSISEGTGTSDVSKRWINEAQTRLRYRNGFGSGATFPFIPTVPKTTATGFPVTRAGSILVDSSYGLGWRTGILTDDTSTVTFTFTGTSAKLMYFKASGTGVMNITVDGGASVILDTNSTRNPPAGNGTNTWDTGALSVGAHTITVKRDPSSATGQNVILMGCFTYNGDEAKGVRVLDASYSGMSSAFLTASRNTQASNSLLACGQVGLVVIAIGTNDYGNNIAPATYKSNLEAFIAALRTGNAQYTGTIALVSVYKSDGRDEALWQSYEKQLYDIAAADANTAFFDWRLRMPDNPKPFDAPQGLGLYKDSLHPSDDGSAWAGTIMADYLSLRA